MDGAQVGVLEEWNKVGLSSLLKGKHGWALESEFLFEFVSEFADWIRSLITESLEGQLSDEQAGGLLIFPNLSKSDGSGAETMGLFDACGDRSGLAGNLLGNQLLPGNLLGSGFSCCLFSSCHFNQYNVNEVQIWRLNRFRLNLIG
jgi:hypothetical protein